MTWKCPGCGELVLDDDEPEECPECAYFNCGDDFCDDYLGPFREV